MIFVWKCTFLCYRYGVPGVRVTGKSYTSVNEWFFWLIFFGIFFLWGYLLVIMCPTLTSLFYYWSLGSNIFHLCYFHLRSIQWKNLCSPCKSSSPFRSFAWIALVLHIAAKWFFQWHLLHLFPNAGQCPRLWLFPHCQRMILNCNLDHCIFLFSRSLLITGSSSVLECMFISCTRFHSLFLSHLTALTCSSCC